MTQSGYALLLISRGPNLRVRVPHGYDGRIVAAHRHSVLLIDDDLAVREPLEELLRQEGLTVAIASDGAEGHEHLRGGTRPCVILLDLRMPGMDGYQFRAEQMRDPALARIPVIVLSGDDLIDEKALELGIEEYLRKPVDIDQFIAAIDSHCDR